jgi:hypothetical protein
LLYGLAPLEHSSVRQFEPETDSTGGIVIDLNTYSPVKASLNALITGSR